MFLLPFLLQMERSRRNHDQQFALPLTLEDILTLVSPPPSRDYFRPWSQSQLTNMLHDAGAIIKTDKQKFQFNLDIQHFAPEEISVKTVEGYVVVEGKHEEKRDQHGWVSRKFVRRYALPEGCDADAVQSSLSSDGVLTVTAPLKCLEVAEHVVPIVHTGPVKLLAKGVKADEIGKGESTKKLVENGQ